MVVLMLTNAISSYYVWFTDSISSTVFSSPFFILPQESVRGKTKAMVRR